MEKFTYEVTIDGYVIYNDGKEIIRKYEYEFEDNHKTYEENAIAEINKLKEKELKIQKEKNELNQFRNEYITKRTEQENEEKQRITNIEIALTEIYEMRLEQ